MSDPVRGLFRYCKVQKKVVPIDEVMVEIPAKISHSFIPDEIAPTRHPIDGKYYTSKAKFRAVTRAHNCEEVGDSWDNDIKLDREMMKEIELQERRYNQSLHERFKANLNGSGRR